jgi:hypothetical protein
MSISSASSVSASTVPSWLPSISPWSPAAARQRKRTAGSVLVKTAMSSVRSRKDTIGTRITLDLKDDTDDEKYSKYLEEYKIRDLVKKYSDYVRYPIEMECTKSVPDPTDKEKTLTRRKSRP